MEAIKILVVDDNREGCDTMVLLFKAMKYLAVGVYDGKTAIERATEIRPNLMLLDIGMPGMNGWEVAEILRHEVALSAMRIYALTGYSDPADMQRSFEAGMDWHFIKPLDMDVFQEVLQKHGLSKH